MAQQVTIVLIDDLTGEEANETVTFGLDGVEYTIDLSEGNADRLRVALADFVGSARRVSGSGKSRAGVRRKSAKEPTGVSREQRQAVREWARKNGHAVGDRGRIPQEIWDAFEVAHA